VLCLCGRFSSGESNPMPTNSARLRTEFRKI
jgi:hypothetical protein